MLEKQIKIIFNRYLNNKSSKEEKIKLEKTLDDFQDKETVWDKQVLGDKELVKQRIFSNIEKSTHKKSTRSIIHLFTNPFIKYAAAILIFLGIGYVFVMEENQSFIDKEMIVLEMGDGSQQNINIENSKEIKNAEGEVVGAHQKEKIKYIDKEQTIQKIVFNTLYVPYGKRFQLELSDGSKVFLNAGSKVKYPVRFIKGQKREVFLDGEAYFEVAKNKKDPFIVHANSLITKVYGTEFNVSSYKNDDSETVVLVEGSVGVFTEDTTKPQTMLVPNQQAYLDKASHLFQTKSVNVQEYIAWKDGKLVFENERFENVVRRLERHYNVKIQNNNATLNDIRFTGAFDIESIDEVLGAFKTYKSFAYKKEKQSIIINP